MITGPGTAATLIAQSTKKQKILAWVFSIVAILFLALAIFKSIVFRKSVRLNEHLQMFFDLTPVMEVLVIISALLLALWKLRSFHKNYNLAVDITKLWLHFSIVVLLLLIFVVGFFKN